MRGNITVETVNTRDRAGVLCVVIKHILSCTFKTQTTTNMDTKACASNGNNSDVHIISAEKVDSNFAEMDPTMARDPRVIVNLLALERSTMPHCDYFRHVQRDIQPFMRKVVTTWMLEVGRSGWWYGLWHIDTRYI